MEWRRISDSMVYLSTIKKCLTTLLDERLTSRQCRSIVILKILDLSLRSGVSFIEKRCIDSYFWFRRVYYCRLWIPHPPPRIIGNKATELLQKAQFASLCRLSASVIGPPSQSYRLAAGSVYLRIALHWHLLALMTCAPRPAYIGNFNYPRLVFYPKNILFITFDKYICLHPSHVPWVGDLIFLWLSQWHISSLPCFRVFLCQMIVWIKSC